MAQYELFIRCMHFNTISLTSLHLFLTIWPSIWNTISQKIQFEIFNFFSTKLSFHLFYTDKTWSAIVTGPLVVFQKTPK